MLRSAQELDRVLPLVSDQELDDFSDSVLSVVEGRVDTALAQDLYFHFSAALEQPAHWLATATNLDIDTVLAMIAIRVIEPSLDKRTVELAENPVHLAVELMVKRDVSIPQGLLLRFHFGDDLGDIRHRQLICRLV
jgi:hypothetical protein